MSRTKVIDQLCATKIQFGFNRIDPCLLLLDLSSNQFVETSQVALIHLLGKLKEHAIHGDTKGM
ncbi:hypothetical protein D3C84_1236410 [compost metagenome]